jgi:2-hydroxychromene-2-carboxylate isomerase
LKEVFARIAGSFGLDTGSFLADIDSDAVMLDVKESQRHGILHCVWSTPTFVINGSEVPSLGSSTSPEDWMKYLTGLLA